MFLLPDDNKIISRLSIAGSTPDSVANLLRCAGYNGMTGNFADAAEKWRQALEAARAVDVAWIHIRIGFCVNAAARCWGNAQ